MYEENNHAVAHSSNPPLGAKLLYFILGVENSMIIPKLDTLMFQPISGSKLILLSR